MGAIPLELSMQMPGNNDAVEWAVNTFTLYLLVIFHQTRLFA